LGTIGGSSASHVGTVVPKLADFYQPAVSADQADFLQATMALDEDF